MKNYSIIGIDGRTFRSKTNINPKHEVVSLSGLGLVDGIYIIRVETAFGPIVKKFILRN